MSKKDLTTTLFCGAIALTFMMAMIWASSISLAKTHTEQTPQVQQTTPIQREQPAQRMPDMKPNEGTLYVWATPGDGFQSMICMKVIDGQTIEAAYLVPIRLKIKGGSPTKKSQELLEKHLAGQLRTALLGGVDQTGTMTADFWMTAEKPTDSKWLSKDLEQNK